MKHFVSLPESVISPRLHSFETTYGPAIEYSCHSARSWCVCYNGYRRQNCVEQVAVNIEYAKAALVIRTVRDS